MTKAIIEQKRAEYEEQKKTSEFISYVGGKIRACDELLAAIKPCVWTKDKERGWWKTSCGRLANYKEKFCPYCGNAIKEGGE